MDVTENETSTLRAEGRHPPLVFENHSQDTRYKGPIDVSQTVLSTFGNGGNNQPFVLEVPTAYTLCSKNSNSMQSNNPHSGIYEADASRTLDENGGNPACNQGGVIVLEGSGTRPSHHGTGYKEADTMYTLNTVETHGVAYRIDRATFNMGCGSPVETSQAKAEKHRLLSPKAPVQFRTRYTLQVNHRII